MAEHFTVVRTRDFDRDADAVFAAWMDPAIRARFETPEGSGMSHATVATREGETGEVVVAPAGTEVGRMFDTIRILRPGLGVVQGWGAFGGVTTMTMQNTFEVVDRPGGGCTFTGTSQMVVTGEGPTEAQVGRGLGRDARAVRAGPRAGGVTPDAECEAGGRRVD